jgi:hypothetical protein
MGNTVSFEMTNEFYIATIKEIKLNRVVYSSIFELGDLENIKTTYNANQIPIEIYIYDAAKCKRLYNIQYNDIKNRKITFIVQSKNKKAMKSVIQKIKHMIRWKQCCENNNLHLRPRNTVKFPLFMYEHLINWRRSTILILENTERQHDMKIVYLEKKQIFAISSNNISANKRIIQKLKMYKKNVKNEHINKNEFKP